MMKISFNINGVLSRLFKAALSSYKQKQSVLLVAFSFLFFFILTYFVLNFVLNQTEEKTRTNTINIIQASLNSSHNSIKNIWVKDQFNGASIWASDLGLLNSTKELLKLSKDPQLLLQSEEMIHIREYFKERLRHYDAFGIFIISPDFISLASMRDQNVGTTNLIAKEHKDRLEKVFKGHNQIIPPMLSDAPFSDKNGNLVERYPTMFIVVPIKDTDGSVIAALSIRFNPFQEFAQMAQITQIAESGETYLIDKTGKLLTESRFIDDLYSTHLLENGNYSMLNIEVRNPGVNLLKGLKPKKTRKEQPFTYAAEQVIKNKSGSSKIAYRDYRGVNVLGAWIWDEDLDIGFIVEIDEDEALMSYRNTRLLTISLLLITICLMIFLSFINWRKQLKNIRIIEQNERYFRTLLNNAVNGIIIINDRGIIEIFNEAAEHIFGYTADEIIGKNISMLSNEQDKYIHNYIEIKTPNIIGSNKEVIGIRKDGSSFPISLGISKINLNNRLVFMGMVSDLTQEKEAKKKLHDIQEKLSLTFDQTPISIVITDINAKYTKVNQAFCDLLGYSEEELLKITFKDITFQEDLNKSIKKFESIKKAKQSGYSLEKRYVKKTGEVIWCNVTVKVLLDNANKKQGLIIVLEDITLRKNAENTLKNHSKELELSNTALEKAKRAALNMMQDANSQRERAENVLLDLEKSNKELNKLNQAIEHSLATVVITDRMGVIEYVNPAFTRTTGYTLEEAIGNTPNIVKSGKHPVSFYKDLWNTINAGKTWKGDFINKKKSGEEFWESASISPIHNNKVITHFVSVKEDITARKFLEAELIKSKDEANKANKAKSTFLANMSHEIRTPMNAILGFSEILSKRIKDPSQLDYLSSIQSSGKTLLELINGILDLSKIESGKMDFSFEPTNIKNLIQEIIGMLAIKSSEKGLQLNVKISEKLPNVLYLEELRLKQILINLINNSIKFTEKGTVDLEVTTQNKMDNYVDLILKVKDTGVGIPEKDHKKIFQAFDQLGGLDTKKYEGTGLGLAITQQLVKLMNGNLTLKSKVDEGSVFTIILKKVKICSDEIQIEETIEFDPNSIQFEESMVLIVDDIKNNRDVLKGYMDDYKINIIEAENGQEAIIAIEKQKPDLVFLDLRMPVMDGFEAIDIIKKNPNWSNIPVIAITASAFDEDEKKVIALGFNGYVSKPAGLNEIVKLLQKYLKHTIISMNKKEISGIAYQPIDKWEEVLGEVNKKAMPILEEIKLFRKKEKVLSFGKLLLKIGENFDATPLINYGNELLLASQEFNITKEKKLIQEFPEFIKNLNSLSHE